MDVQVERNQDQVTTVVVEPTVIESETPGVEKVRVEELRINRNTLVTFFKKLIHQGNVRHIAIENKQGEKIVEIPLLIGGTGLILGTLLLPPVAAVGAIVVSAANLSFVIERKE